MLHFMLTTHLFSHNILLLSHFICLPMLRCKLILMITVHGNIKKKKIFVLGVGWVCDYEMCVSNSIWWSPGGTCRQSSQYCMTTLHSSFPKSSLYDTHYTHIQSHLNSALPPLKICITLPHWHKWKVTHTNAHRATHRRGAGRGAVEEKKLLFLLRGMSNI